MPSSLYRSVSAEIENMNLFLNQLRPYGTLKLKKVAASIVYTPYICMGCFVLFRGSVIHTIQYKYKGLYNFQLYSLHEQSTLMYLGLISFIRIHRHRQYTIQIIILGTGLALWFKVLTLSSKSRWEFCQLLLKKPKLTTSALWCLMYM